ncbi:hypothetical protein JCGZ_00277 [Jatropha curcas]|uniref:Uncharacterized protein n=1 Tax=Jatropha curcas TaxID=180498 RepID=A0A067LDA6_JATCU|nr:hypothetical protein JCGZ_00277 [Jatropha curcas]
MADAYLSNVVGGVISNLVSPALREAKLWWGVKDELDKLKKTVSTVQAVLLDAEEQYSQSHQVKVWIDSLKEAFYDADDLLDEFSIRELEKKVMTGNKLVKEVRLFFSSSNQFIHSIKMAHKIKEIRCELDGIAENRKFYLNHERSEKRDVMSNYQDRDQTHSSLPEVVIGREDEKKTIIQFLLSSNCKANASIVSVVGIGGLGKTTLAQLVFNDEIVKSHFGLKLWICIYDNFDVKTVVEKILESITGAKPAENCEMNTLKNLLHEHINGKKYLLVLDDVWNEDYEKWFRLKDLLIGGARGSKIIVTTRLKIVAERIRSDSIYELQGLSNVESWSLFVQMASKQGKVESEEHELVGKEIVAKCVGVPLAIRAIGRLLYFKDTISEWQSFKDRELANIDKEDASILPTLMLSYNHLPSHLKCCFAYCSLFPKACRIDLRFLVNRLGYIRVSDSKQNLEDIGLQYFKDLLWRSFFQEVLEDPLGNIFTFKMHDLMSDLAAVVAGEEINLLRSDAECVKVKERSMHLSIDSEALSWRQLPRVLPVAKKARSFLAFNKSMTNEIKERQLDMIFSNVRRIRVLNLPNLAMERVPPSIDRLKHLKYLNLSNNKRIEILPNSITRLQNLQTLALVGCKRFKQLPKHMKKLVNLRQLYIEGCFSLTHMPCGLGQLTSLQNLPLFVLAKDNGVSKESGGLDELRNLNSLRESLAIINLQYVKNAASEFEAVKLKEKQHLQTLQLEWKSEAPYDINSDSDLNDDNKEISLEELWPHQNLKWLIVSGCGKVKFPSWISNLSNLVELQINGCKHCQRFPPLDQFPFLKRLSIKNFTDLEYIESGIEMSGSALFFPSLEKLWLENCPNLKGWWRFPLLKFHCLSYLGIVSCTNLTSMPLIPSVESLLLKSTSIKSLDDILKMKIQSRSSSPSSITPALSQLKTLTLEKVEDLKFLDEELMQNFTSLQQLEIFDCPTITTVPRAIKYLTSLKNLMIRDCEELDFSDDENVVSQSWQAWHAWLANNQRKLRR